MFDVKHRDIFTSDFIAFGHLQACGTLDTEERALWFSSKTFGGMTAHHLRNRLKQRFVFF